MDSPGLRFKAALSLESPLAIAGTINAYTALLAQQAGFKAIYLSGAGVANASLGMPDLGMTNLNDVLEDARRITAIVPLPLLVDIDTGWGTTFTITRAIRALINAGVAAVHLEDQYFAKRCGHRPGKKLTSTIDMVHRIQSAVDAKTDPNFIIMARCDALAVEGLDRTIERLQMYVEAGADMIFFEGAKSLAEYQAVTRLIKKPVLANLTEFGLTPLFTKEELAQVGVQMLLYPLSAFRAMSAAAKNVYAAIKQFGTQASVIDSMQSREELYETLHYYQYEEQLNKILAEKE